ncbi:carotenoid oxygenase family protein [Nannocystis pusilla]|uniref:Carotenoid oxygenase family protein n=1 Tax=Nannocystis pusilla TaxID=889268 RepID=A0ABS7TVB1_9BACT|nr:carotenoid oxygenase family protein [Nannocystis pusilla]MBZ5712200.1 carotenoid oxygenase family protein [Nannocystis pusilla]
MTAAPELYEIYERSNEAVTQEYDVRLPLVEGVLPEALRGVLFRNGPGRLELYGHRYGHLFDGDGHINRFAFDGRGVTYRNRYVRTREFLAEESARRILFRNFGTNIPGGLLKNLLRTRFKNVANTSVVHHGGKLLALWEAGWPHHLDADNLDTLARDDLGGSLRNPGSLVERLVAPELPFSAHPRVCPTTGELFNFGLAATGTRSRLCLYRVDAGGRAAPPEFIDLPGGYFIHDFVLTARHRVFFLTPTAFDLPRMLLGLSPPVQTMRPVPGPTQILVVDRHGTGHRRTETSACFIFHFPNGYEDDGGTIVLDGFRMERFPDLNPRPDRPEEHVKPYLTRYRIDPGGSVREDPLTDHTGELGTIRPDRTSLHHRYVWSIGSAPGRKAPFSTGLLKVDCDRAATTFRDFGPDLTGEPVFVPRPGRPDEDDGWLLSLHYVDAERACHLLVLDARDLATVARLRLPHATPLGFHGTFVAAGT